MAQEVFQRIEKKYMLDVTQMQQLRLVLDAHMRPDEFGAHTICNIYFDTPDFDLTRMSIEKPVYKEKLRLRSYGVPSDGDEVFVEIKKKYKGVVYKRRACLTLRQARDYLYKGKQPGKDTQIMHEIDYFMRMHHPEPMVYLCYDRIAMFDLENPALRITFDSNIRWRVSALDLSKGAWGTPVLKPEQRLMEIKIPGAMPLWLADALDALHIYPTSFSKIGTVYETALAGMLEYGGYEKCSQAY